MSLLLCHSRGFLLHRICIKGDPLPGVPAEQIQLAGFDGKADKLGGGVHNILRVDDGADGGSLAAFMGGNYADIPAHDLDTAQMTAQGAVLL